MSEEERRRILERMSSSGATVTIYDPRVSQVQNWLIGIVGVGILVALGWLATSVDKLNRNFERITVTLEYMETRIARLENAR